MKQQLICSVMIAFFLLTGCASMSNRTKCAATGAAVGAAVGATAGGIIGHNNNGAHVRTEGAIVGGVLGAVVGGTAGFLICRNDDVIVEPAPQFQPAPPSPPPVARTAPQPAPQPVAQKIVLNSIRFDFDKSTIKPEFYPILDAAVQALKQRPDSRIEIQGHTDSIGTQAYNRSLAKRRAEAVQAYLIRQGVARGNLSVNSFGEDMPVANNQTAEGRRMNRRVEFIVNN
jgi:OmpA-OmpF porin, OOP family